MIKYILTARQAICGARTEEDLARLNGILSIPFESEKTDLYEAARESEDRFKQQYPECRTWDLELEMLDT